MASTWTDDVVLGDHLLARHVQHLLHHVHPAADALDEGGQEADAGLQGAGVAAEPLDGEFAALRHDLDGPEHDDQGQDDEDRCDDIQSFLRNGLGV